MTVWLVRAGKSGDMEDGALEKGVAVIGWNDLGDLSKAKTRAEFNESYHKAIPRNVTTRTPPTGCAPS